jgi:hypothetical protein
MVSAWFKTSTAQEAVPLFRVLAQSVAEGSPMPFLFTVSQSDALIHSAARHGLSGYVAQWVHGLPPQAQAALKKQAQAELGLATRHRALLFAVLDALATVNVVATPLKGYGLAQRVYPRPLTRPSSDVDILIEAKDFPQAQAALLKLGCVQAPQSVSGDESHAQSWQHPLGLLELHHSLYRGFGGPGFPQALLTRVAGEVSGRPVQFLQPEVEFVALAAHAAQSVYLRASWLLDLALFRRTHAALDFENVLALSRRTGHTRTTAAALALLRLLFHQAEPFETAPLLGPRAVLLERLFSAQHLADASLSEQRAVAFVLRVLFLDSKAAWVRYCARGVRRAAEVLFTRQDERQTP